MYKGYKIIVNTAAGRRRYMQYLVPFVLASDIVDRYDIWINTHNGADIEFFKQLAAKYPVVNLVWQPDGYVSGNKSINAFYKKCTEEKTIYFKMDDDIVWMEPNAIQRMVDFRIDNPQYFLVSPLVINNSLSTYLLEIANKIKLNEYYNSYSSHPILWKSGEFASQLHQWFIDKYLSVEKYSDLHVGKHEMGMTRFSINAILWFGEDLRRISGIVPGDDEEYLSCIYPTQLGVSNCWNGDVIFSHFAFFTQREQLDKQSILEQYGEYLLENWSHNQHMKNISATVQAIMRHISEHEAELMAKPSPYRKDIVSQSSFKHKLKHYIPVSFLQVYRMGKQIKNNKQFILY